MIQYPNSVPMTERRQEIVQGKTWDFPYTAMEAELTRYAGGSTPWHWHDHFEIAVVHSGCMELCTRQGSILLKEGEGYFLNANVLHHCRVAEPGGNACMHAQLFTRDLLPGTGLVGRRYVATIENCVGLELLRLDPQDAAHRAILDDVNAAFAAAEGDADGCELFVCAHLTSAWGKIYGLMEERLRENKGVLREDAMRAKQMLSFIYENYKSPIAVKQIAAAAGICERECFRCFADILDTTPMLYLTRHRVATAARALAETNASIADIAESCGFSNAGYFGKVFRRHLGCTPGEYRKKNS